MTYHGIANMALLFIEVWGVSLSYRVAGEGTRKVKQCRRILSFREGKKDSWPTRGLKLDVVVEIGQLVHPDNSKYVGTTPPSFEGQELVNHLLQQEDHGVNPLHINECCYECRDALDGIFCQQCICKSCGKGAHTGYNYPPKVPIISNPEPCNQTMNNELPQTLPSFDSTYYSEKESSVPCVSKPNFVDKPSNIFNPPPQPPIYSCEFYGSNAKYGHYCTPQAPFNNPELGKMVLVFAGKCGEVCGEWCMIEMDEKMAEKSWGKWPKRDGGKVWVNSA
nr:hypothetical protein [Tanacetum cinerariifolium]